MLSYDDVSTVFDNDLEDLEASFKFLKTKSATGYDFASIDVSEDRLRFVLGKEGIQYSSTLADTVLSGVFYRLVKQKGYYMYKQGDVIYYQVKGYKRAGKTSVSGIAKSLSGMAPDLSLLPWVGANYEVQALHDGWFYYKY